MPNAEFLGWFVDDELVSKDLEYRFAVTADKTVTAKFTDIVYNNLHVEVDGNGIINFKDGAYPADVQINLEAEPANGYEFVEWTSTNGGEFKDSKAISTVFTMPDKETTVIAHFKPIDSEKDTSVSKPDTDGGTVTNADNPHSSPNTGDSSDFIAMINILLISCGVLFFIRCAKIKSNN